MAICVNHEHVRITILIISFVFKALIGCGWAIGTFLGFVSFGKNPGTGAMLWIIWLCRSIAVITLIGFSYLWFFVC